MVKYRNVHTSFWDDKKVSVDFTPEDRYFFLYLLTNDHTSISGCYELTMRSMAYETGYSQEAIKALIERMESVHKVIAYSEETSEMLVVNWWKFNWARSPKLIKSVENDARKIKDDSFREYVLKAVNDFADEVDVIPYTYGMDTVCIPYQTSSLVYSDTSSDTSSDTNSEAESRKDAFLAATLNGICPQCKHNSMHQRPSDDGRFVWECHNGCEVSWISEVSNG